LSELAQRAVAGEVERRRKVDLLDAYLAELDDELGPASPEQVAEAERWAASLAEPDTGHESRSRSA